MYEYVKPKQNIKSNTQMPQKKSSIPSTLNKFDTGLTPKPFMNHYTAPVLQMVRKRVKGKPDVLDNTDIYYDKNDGNYYNGVRKEGEQKELLIAKAEFEEFNRIKAKNGRALKTTILAEAKQGSDKKYMNHCTEQKEIESDPNSLSIKADTFTEGGAVPTPPKAIRLYAEGDMAHALSLSETIHEPGKFDAFKDLNTDTVVNGNGATPEVLIKATEFDTADAVTERYSRVLNVPSETPHNQKRVEHYYVLGVHHCEQGKAQTALSKREAQYQTYYNLGYTNCRDGCAYRTDSGKHQTITDKLTDASKDEHLEASFGESTGDLSRTGKEQSRRKYDIIQATFFWIPEATNVVNFNNLKLFMTHQHRKLKPDGKIRITLTNSSSGTDKSDYHKVATNLIQDPDLIALYDLNLIDLGTKYSEKLRSLDMNPKDFKHTATASDTEVSSPGDYILAGTLKPVPTEEAPET